MRVYRVPLMLDEEQKPIGGLLSLRQAAYLLSGLVSSVATYQFAPGGEARWYAVLTLVGASLALAFVRIPRLDVDLDRYLLLWVRRLMAPREYPFVRR